MAIDRLGTYRRKRDAAKTPEPVPEAGPQEHGSNDTFVIQEHHARALHWDFRLERDGVLVSWALPKGIPNDPKKNHLAVQTEDHPMSYASFEGDIPAGEYGGGNVTIWDAGTYETQKWRDKEIIVVLHGQRVNGRFVLFKTGGKQWMIHRMDAPVRPDYEPMPELIEPMLATPSTEPPLTSQGWAFEMKWDGLRAVTYIDGGRAKVLTRNGNDVRTSFPEIALLAESLAGRELILDGEIVALNDAGRPDFGRLQQRMHVKSPGAVRGLLTGVPVNYLIFDVLYADGTSMVGKPYTERREVLEGLGLSGPNWAVPPIVVGNGPAALASSQALELEGIIAKRLTAKYQPARRSRDWVKIKNIKTQEVVIIGWTAGQGRRGSSIGALLLAVPDDDGDLAFAGKVGTGFTDAMLRDLAAKLAPIVRDDCPVAEKMTAAVERDATWVEPFYVGEVAFTEWTATHRIRHPAWRGLRPDKAVSDVVRES